MNNEEKILSMLEALVQKTDTLVTKTEVLEVGQNQTNQRLDALEGELAETKQIVACIENVHGKKLDALYEGFLMNHDAVVDIRSDIAEMKSAQEKQDIRIRWTETKVQP